MSNKLDIPDIDRKIDDCLKKINCDKYASSKRKSACQKLQNDLSKIILDRKNIFTGDYDIPLVRKYFDDFRGCRGPLMDECVKKHGEYMNIYKSLVVINHDLNDIDDDINIIETLENRLGYIVTEELNNKLSDPMFDPTNNAVEIRCTGESNSIFCRNIIEYLYIYNSFNSGCYAEPRYFFMNHPEYYVNLCSNRSEFNKTIANSANKIDPYHSKRSARKIYLDSFFKTSIYVDRNSAEFRVTVPYNNYNY